jgi:D-glycero-D-manno-heptose 1,7-bisphosphate phosphatase|tara:strand:- start:2145 stop:2891 length:747 start_codon:yes stop_codon:yes gene_type:complete
MNCKKINQAVILAGGQGKRLRPLTDHLPKPMAPVNGKPFLDYLIHSVISVGINKILFLVGYKSEYIISRYSKINIFSSEFSIGSVNYKTGRRLLNAYKLLDDYFLLLYGDNYWPLELDLMLDLYNCKNVNVTTTVFSNENGTGEYGYENNIFVRKNCLVGEYDRKRKSKKTNGIDIGYFIINKSELNSNIALNVSFEENILLPLIERNQLAAYVTNEQYYYITNLDTLKNFESVVIKNNYQSLPSHLF